MQVEKKINVFLLMRCPTMWVIATELYVLYFLCIMYHIHKNEDN